MSQCPLPTRPDDDEAAMITRMLSAGRIVIVGLSDAPDRPSNEIAQYLLSVGKKIVGVNPNRTTILGQPCYPSLADVPGPIEVVDVFRRPEHCAEVTRQAIAAGAKGVWLQSGIISEEAAQLARAAGIDFVQNRCIKVEHWRRSR